MPKQLNVSKRARNAAIVIGVSLFLLISGLNMYITSSWIGSERHRDYTVIGNQVNLAARLQGLAAGGEIIISHATYGGVKDFAEVEDRGEVTVKGLHQPVKTYKVVDLT